MNTFQNDLLLTINSSHELYLNKINNLFENTSIIQDLSLDDTQKLIEHIKEYNYLINSICFTIDNINNIKNQSNIEEKIEKELILKMIPIMNIYRTLLYEKYNKSTSIIYEQD